MKKKSKLTKTKFIITIFLKNIQKNLNLLLSCVNVALTLYFSSTKSKDFCQQLRILLNQYYLRECSFYFLRSSPEFTFLSFKMEKKINANIKKAKFYTYRQVVDIFKEQLIDVKASGILSKHKGYQCPFKHMFWFHVKKVTIYVATV